MLGWSWDYPGHKVASPLTITYWKLKVQQHAWPIITICCPPIKSISNYICKSKIISTIENETKKMVSNGFFKSLFFFLMNSSSSSSMGYCTLAIGFLLLKNYNNCCYINSFSSWFHFSLILLYQLIFKWDKKIIEYLLKNIFKKVNK